jgi:hypothetical protein
MASVVIPVIRAKAGSSRPRYNQRSSSARSDGSSEVASSISLRVAKILMTWELTAPGGAIELDHIPTAAGI